MNNKEAFSVIDQKVNRVKKVCDLSVPEVLSLYDNNHFVQEAAREWSESDFEFAVEELTSKIGKVKGLDYNFGYPGNYMYFSAWSRDAYDDFFEACINTDFGLFTDEDIEKLKRAHDRAGFYRDCVDGYEDISDERFSHLEKYMKNMFDFASERFFEEYRGLEDYYYSERGERDAVLVWADERGGDYYTDGTEIIETELRHYS